MFAYDTLDGRVHISEAIQGDEYYCGEGHRLIPKKGEINIWHYSHKESVSGCTMKNSMTKWHIDWQERFKKDLREVRMKVQGKLHIADIKLSSGLVIEFQHSGITPDAIQDREQFYGEMRWLFDRIIHKGWRIEWKYNQYALIIGLNIPMTYTPTYVSLTQGIVGKILHRVGGRYLMSLAGSDVFFKAITSPNDRESVPESANLDDVYSLMGRCKFSVVGSVRRLEDISLTKSGCKVVVMKGNIGVTHGDEDIFIVGKDETPLEIFMLNDKVVKQ